jgi:hypothetical protein
MKFVVVTAIAALALTLSNVASASMTRTSYSWPSSEKWAFIDAYVDEIQFDGYKYPNLLADCVQKTAAKSFRSYNAWVMASDRAFDRWTRSAPVAHCALVYGDKYFD